MGKRSSWLFILIIFFIKNFSAVVTSPLESVADFKNTGLFDGQLSSAKVSGDISGNGIKNFVAATTSLGELRDIKIVGNVNAAKGAYTIGLKLNGLVQPSKIFSDKKQFDALFSFKDPVILISNVDGDEKLFGLAVAKGISCVSVLEPQGNEFGKILSDLKLFQLTIQTDFSFATWKMPFNGVEDLCLKSILEPYVTKSRLENVAELKNKVERTCINNPVAELIFIKEDIGLRIAGKSSDGAKNLFLVNPLEDNSMQVNVASRYDIPAKLSMVAPRLKPFDNVLQPRNLTLVYRSGDILKEKEKEGIASEEELIYVDKAPQFTDDVQFLDFNYYKNGITTVCEGVVGGPLKNIFSDSFIIKIYDQPGIINKKQEDFFIYFTNFSSKKLCLADILKQVKGAGKFQEALKMLSNAEICFTYKGIAVNQARSIEQETGELFIVILGEIDLWGAKQDVEVWLTYSDGLSVTFAFRGKGEFKLSNINSKLKSVDGLMSMHDAILIVATDLKGPVLLPIPLKEEGIIVGGNLSFSGFLKTTFDLLKMTSPYGHVTLPLSLIEGGIGVGAYQAYEPPLVLMEKIKVYSTDFNVKLEMGMPEFELKLASDVDLAGKIFKTIFVGSIAPLTFSLGGRLEGNILNSPGGFPVTVNDPTLILNFAGGLISGLGGGGSFKVGDEDLSFFLNVNAADPKKLAVAGYTDKLCFPDLMILWQKLAQKAVPGLQIPGLGCLHDSYLVFAKSDYATGGLPLPEKLQKTLFVKYGLPKGISFDGKGDFLGMKVHANGNVSDMGIRFIAETTPLNIENLFVLTSITDTLVGPHMEERLDFSEQIVDLDGKLQIGKSPAILSGQSKVHIDPHGGFFDVKGKMGIFDVDVMGTADFLFDKSKISKTILNGKITSGLDNLVNKAHQKVQAVVEGWKNSAGSMVSSINDSISEINNACNKVPLFSCSTVLKPFKKVVDDISLVNNALSNSFEKLTAPFIFKEASFTVAITAFNFVISELQLKLEIFGNIQTIKIANFDVNNSVAAIEQIVNAIIQQLKPQNMDQTLSAGKNLVASTPSIVQQILASVATGLTSQALEKIGSIAEAAGVGSVIDVTKEIGGKVGNLAPLDDLKKLVPGTMVDKLNLGNLGLVT